MTSSKISKFSIPPAPKIIKCHHLANPPKAIVIRHHLANPPKSKIPTVIRHHCSYPPRKFKYLASKNGAKMNAKYHEFGAKNYANVLGQK